MHPGNVLMTSSGPVVIDWMTSSCGNPAGDVARTLFLLRHSGIPGYVPRIQRNLITLARRRFGSVYLRRYRALRPIDEMDIDAWRLPVLAARISEGIEEERPAVLALLAGARVRALLDGRFAWLTDNIVSTWRREKPRG